MLKALGEELLAARKARHESLDTVAKSAGISAPYLLKLERGQVSSPSPRVLARIAEALSLSYLRLMELAGYLNEEELTVIENRPPQPHPLAGQSLTHEEWLEVGDFISELIARRR
jgi:transcriptional regulator with XRE-family HTH domain